MAASNGSEYFDMDVEAQNETFGRRSNAESVAEDEHELMWAALEKLPTRKRTNMALVKRNADESEESVGRTDTVDVRKLDRNTRQLLVDRAMATSEQDNYKLLAGVKERLDRALPTLVNSVRDVVESILTKLMIVRPKKHSLTILNNVSGVVKPGRMTLLLGPPGSGKTSLLLALSGKLDSGLKTDNHIAELTVRETLDFAARCQGSSKGFADYIKDLDRLEKERSIRPNSEIDAYMKV
ncbi:ABC transporter G family member 31 [Capsicum chinense]|nr:ABC transporter G family member 31 [Capsicum chinense]